MIRAHVLYSSLTVAVAAAIASACGGSAASPEAGAVASSSAPAAISAAPVAAEEQPLSRFIRATGSLTAEDQADVAAETPGRIVATPIERGTVVSRGAVLVRIAADEGEARLREAEANAAQIEARLGLTAESTFDPAQVPEVQNARASFELAQSEFDRIKSLLAERVVSQSEFDQRRTQMEAARQQYEAARNAAAQQYQALLGARSRVALARKAVEDTIVRAPFDGVVAERLVSVGDYVNTGTKVAVVVRVDPLRVVLTVPEQFISSISAGQSVTFNVDAYPGRAFEGKVRFVSPALEAAQRSLTVEAVVANPTRELKPGLFATARIEQAEKTPGVVVPAGAIRTAAGTTRLFVVQDGRAEERVVTVGQSADGKVEITSGLKAGERVATANVAQLADGVAVAQ